jgi:GcrA cell cycle regulator
VKSLKPILPRVSQGLQIGGTSLRLAIGAIISLMGWDTKDVALLKQLWAAGQSAAQIARRLGCSRNAVCGRLTRLGLKRGHKPPTAKPKIRPAPKRRPALAACARPVLKRSSKPQKRQQPKDFSKRQLYDILAEAVRNTG